MGLCCWFKTQSEKTELLLDSHFPKESPDLRLNSQRITLSQAPIPTSIHQPRSSSSKLSDQKSFECCLKEFHLIDLFKKTLNKERHYKELDVIFHCRKILRLISLNTSSPLDSSELIIEYPTSSEKVIPFCHIILTNEFIKKGFELLLRTSITPFSSGTYLYTYKAVLIKVPPAHEFKGKFTYTHKVLKIQNIYNSKGQVQDQVALGSLSKTILNGYSHHQKLQALFNTSQKVNLAALPKLLTPPEITPPGFLAIMQNKYHSDMSQILFPCLTNPTKQNNLLNIFEVLSLLIQVGVTLDEIHKVRQAVHCDIKPNNILVEFPTKKAMLSDFDLFREFGRELPEISEEDNPTDFSSYIYSDHCLKNGWATPLCDTWGLILSLLCIVCPQSIDQILKNEVIYLSDQNFIAKERKEIFFYYLTYRTPYDFLSCQNEFREELLILIDLTYYQKFDEFKNSIEELITKYPALKQQEINALRRLPKDVTVIQTIYDFVCEAYKRSKNAWNLLSKNKEMQQALLLEGRSCVNKNDLEVDLIDIERKKSVIAELEKAFYSIPQIIEWFKSLQNVYKET